MSPEASPRDFAELVFREDGTPFAPQYDDVYCSSSGAGQASLVFVEGNGVRHRLRAEGQLAILETGFGLGLNLAATLHAALQVNRPVALQYHAIELHPVRPADLERAQYQFGAELAAEDLDGEEAASALTQAYSQLLESGTAELQLGKVTVRLELSIGDGAAALSTFQAKYDAVYLDGFAPSRNPDLWSGPVFREIARLSRRGTSIATYTVAQAVRQGLEAVGFEVEKVLGFGDKRYRLMGSFVDGAARGSVPSDGNPES